jgi:hypothetical protein
MHVDQLFSGRIQGSHPASEGLAAAHLSAQTVLVSHVPSSHSHARRADMRALPVYEGPAARVALSFEASLAVAWSGRDPGSLPDIRLWSLRTPFQFGAYPCGAYFGSPRPPLRGVHIPPKALVVRLWWCRKACSPGRSA